MKRKGFSIAAGILISAVLLAGSLYNVDIPALLASLSRVGLPTLALVVLSMFLSCLFRALMWRITTAGAVSAGLTILFGGVVVGQLVNGLLPLRAGEIFRAQYLATMGGTRRTTALATILIERLFDVLSLGTLVAVGVLIGIGGLSSKTAQLFLVIWITVMALAALVIMNLEALQRRSTALAFVPRRAVEIIANILAPLGQLRDLRRFIALCMLSFLVWTCNYLGLLALIGDSTAALKTEASLLLFLFLNIGMLVPAAPGAIGIVQVAFWMSLARFGVPREQALALSFVYLATAYAFNGVVGAPFFLRAHLKLSEILSR